MPGRGSNNNSNVSMRRSVVKRKGNGAGAKAASTKAGKSSKEANSEEVTETPYERLYNKVMGNKPKKRNAADIYEVAKPKRNKSCVKSAGSKSTKEDDQYGHLELAMAQFEEEGNIMDMGVTDEQTKEFPSNSEDEQDSDSDQEEELLSSAQQSQDSNNNKRSRGATSVAAMMISSQGSAGPEENDIVIQGHVKPNTKESGPSAIVNSINEVQPSTSTGSPSKMPDLHTFNLMQSFMLKKGLIDRSMTEEEMQELVNCGSDNVCKTPNNNTQKASKVSGNQSTRKKGANLNKDDATGQQGKVNLELINKSPSELTVYRRAIPSIPSVQPQSMNQ